MFAAFQRLYELRHTFVSVVKTLPAGEVKGLVGHSQDMDTFGVYGHTLTGEAEEMCIRDRGEVQRLEADLQIETTPAIAKLQRETYDESREIYHKLMQ